MRLRKLSIALGGAAIGVAVLGAIPAFGADHRDAPLTKAAAKSDINDVYAFSGAGGTAVMVAAVSRGQGALGMLLIVAFSLGLAGVLIAIGVSLILGKRIPESRQRMFQHPLVGRAMAALPVVSAFVAMVAGLAITYQVWNQPGL
jgi:MFS family permease